MIPFADKTVTLYNKCSGQDENGRTTTTWFRHVLTGCFWFEEFRTVVVGTVEQRVHDITCQIPGNNTYLPYASWASDGVDRTKFFTLSPDDIIVLGTTIDEIGIDITAAELIGKYKRSGVMLVQSSSDNTGLLMPHYAAQGV